MKTILGFAITLCGVAALAQSAGVVQDETGTHLAAYHSAFDEQPAHRFEFNYFKNDGGLTARGSWKSITEHKGDEMAFVHNVYLSCTKAQRVCIEATAQAGTQPDLYPRAELSFYNIKRWDGQSLEADDDSPICVKNVLTIEFKTARVIVADVIRQDKQEVVKSCSDFGVHRTTTYQLW